MGTIFLESPQRGQSPLHWYESGSNPTVHLSGYFSRKFKGKKAAFFIPRQSFLVTN